MFILEGLVTHWYRTLTPILIMTDKMKYKIAELLLRGVCILVWYKLTPKGLHGLSADKRKEWLSQAGVWCEVLKEHHERCP